MTHPKLPPKYKVMMLGGFNMLIFTRQRDLSFLSSQTPLPREWVAAILETEWRKRAARWCKLRDGVFDKWLLMQERAPDESWVEEHWLYGLSQCAENKCYEIAKEWRAWGEGK